MSTTPTSSERPSLSLATAWDTVHRLLRGDLSTQEAAAVLGVPAERLDIYPRFVEGHVRGAVEKNHSILAALLEGPAWGDLVRAYFVAHPPRSYELNEAAAAFPAFVAAQVADGGAGGLTAFHRDLAALEWEEWRVYAARVDVPEPAAVRHPTLNPTLAILTFAWPVGSFVAAWRRARAAGAAPPPVPDGPLPDDARETVFVFRHPATHRVLTRPAAPDLLFAFKVAHDGVAVEDAAHLAGLEPAAVDAILSAAARTGLVVLPERSRACRPGSMGRRRS